jgi:uridine kinase
VAAIEPIHSPAVRALVNGLIAQRNASTRPLVVALDGRSGVGKSSLAAALAGALDGSVLDGDSFFAGGVVVRSDAPERLAADCIDWRQQRPVLALLRHGREATYHAFDWQAFNGNLEPRPTVCVPKRVVIFEGVYSARPELADLVDVRVLLRVPEAVRIERLLAREGAISPWEGQWHAAEEWYFRHAAPPEGFDVVIDLV